MDPRSEQVAAVFDLVADTYDDVGVPWFGPIAAGLVDALAPGPGDTVLDIGCGKGAATFLLAERVAPDGRIVGLDLSEGMLAHARRIADERGVDRIEWLVGDAMAPQVPAHGFDVLVASLVLFFLPAPGDALRAWRELLRPGGRIGVTTFGAFDPAIDTLGALLDPYLPRRALDARAPVDEDAFATDAAVERMLASAGFVDPATSHITVEVRLDDPEHWRSWSQSLGQRAAWQRVPEADLAPLMAAAADVFASRSGSDGSLRTHNTVRITTARV